MMYLSEKFEKKAKKLIDKTILNININKGDNILTFVLEDGEVDFNSVGDCCSYSWIEHIESPTEPEKIISFEEIEISPSYEHKPTKTNNNEEEMEYYFFKLTTNKGSYLIEMRNSSNGYYGGFLE